MNILHIRKGSLIRYLPPKKEDLVVDSIIGEVQGITKHNEIIFTEEIGEIAIPLYNCSPILIDKYTFLRLGATECSTYSFMDIKNIQLYQSHNSKLVEVLYKKNTCVKYVGEVHILQNLVIDLTGVSLKLKELGQPF